MPFAAPPKVRIGASDWLDTVWDDVLTAAGVAASGGPDMSVRDVQYLHWTAQLDAEPPRVFKLLAAGVDAPDTAGVVVKLPAGRHPTVVRTRPAGSPEIREIQTTSVSVRA